MPWMSRLASRAADFAGLRRHPAPEPLNSRYSGLTLREVFSTIYGDKQWGAGGGRDFSSGSGSHDPAIVGGYIDAAGAFLAGLPFKPDVVDLGCGDFNIGSHLRSMCAAYVGVDVVPALVERNRAQFADLDVRFECLDIVDDPLPRGDVVFIRQVLQHLGNAQIARVVPKLARFKHVVVTEHIPSRRFVPNRDMQAGAGVRLFAKPESGIVLTAPPFDFQVRAERTLCEFGQYGGTIRTIVYQPAE